MPDQMTLRTTYKRISLINGTCAFPSKLNPDCIHPQLFLNTTGVGMLHGHDMQIRPGTDDELWNWIEEFRQWIGNDNQSGREFDKFQLLQSDLGKFNRFVQLSVCMTYQGEMARKFIAGKYITPLILMMGSGDRTTRYLAINLLVNLSYIGEFARKMGEGGAVDPLVNIVERDIENIDPALVGLANIVRNLTKISRDAVERYRRRIPNVIRFLKETDTMRCLLAVTLLINLSKIPRFRPIIVKQIFMADACRSLVKITKGEDSEIKCGAIQVIKELSTIPDFLSKMVEEGVIPPLVAQLTRRPHKYFRNALMILIFLINISKENVKKIGETNVISLLVELIRDGKGRYQLAGIILLNKLFAVEASRPTIVAEILTVAPGARLLPLLVGSDEIAQRESTELILQLLNFPELSHYILDGKANGVEQPGNRISNVVQFLRETLVGGTEIVQLESARIAINLFLSIGALNNLEIGDIQSEIFSELIRCITKSDRNINQVLLYLASRFDRLNLELFGNARDQIGRLQCPLSLESIVRETFLDPAKVVILWTGQNILFVGNPAGNLDAVRQSILDFVKSKEGAKTTEGGMYQKSDLIIFPPLTPISL